MEKIEIGYTEEKERRIEAAKDLQELGKIPSQLAEFGMSRPPMSWQYVEKQNREGP